MTPHDRAYISHLLADAEREMREESWHGYARVLERQIPIVEWALERAQLRADRWKRRCQWAIACLAFVALCAIGLLAVMVVWRRIP